MSNRKIKKKNVKCEKCVVIVYKIAFEKELIMRNEKGRKRLCGKE
jgi:hypothetical protein